jgi:DNA-binding HxlR family transcriptional regulator
MRDRLYMCGVDVALTALGGRWRTIVLAAIRTGASGFAQLRRETPGISEKMLSAALRDLTSTGFVQRTVVRQHPLEVRYTLTDEGCDIAPALASLNDWGEAFARDHGLNVVNHPVLERPRRRRASTPGVKVSLSAIEPSPYGVALARTRLEHDGQGPSASLSGLD